MGCCSCRPAVSPVRNQAHHLRQAAPSTLARGAVRAGREMLTALKRLLWRQHQLTPALAAAAGEGLTNSPRSQEIV